MKLTIFQVSVDETDGLDGHYLFLLDTRTLYVYAGPNIIAGFSLQELIDIARMKEDVERKKEIKEALVDDAKVQEL